MEVHHHAHSADNHRGKKRWSHYFWEFFMLFLAVTLGFFVENMREHHVEKLRVKQYARSLYDDLVKDTAMIRFHIDRIKRNINATDSLSAYLKNRKLNQIRNLDLFVLSSVDRYPPYIWNRATIEQIKNSGSLRYFPRDSIVSQISFYDAYTHHMDEDFNFDEELANRASALKSQLMDMDYPKEFWMGLRNNMDSVLKTSFYFELNAKDSTVLLAKNMETIKVFLNEKLNIRKHLIIRSDEELSLLIKIAESLILALKKEYHLK